VGAARQVARRLLVVLEIKNLGWLPKRDTDPNTVLENVDQPPFSRLLTMVANFGSGNSWPRASAGRRRSSGGKWMALARADRIFSKSRLLITRCAETITFWHTPEKSGNRSRRAYAPSRLRVTIQLVGDVGLRHR
jgi:hypothetical protein